MPRPTISISRLIYQRPENSFRWFVRSLCESPIGRIGRSGTRRAFSGALPRPAASSQQPAASSQLLWFVEQLAAGYWQLATGSWLLLSGHRQIVAIAPLFPGSQVIPQRVVPDQMQREQID